MSKEIRYRNVMLYRQYPLDIFRELLVSTIQV
jgi:hypothetical protein